MLVLDCRSFGGQAGASARIENYLGFPTGISGLALMARAYNQAQKFGAEIAIPDEAQLLLESNSTGFKLKLGNEETVSAKSIVLAGGARYRRLDIPNLADFEGSCVHYWASAVETRIREACGQAWLSATILRPWYVVGPGHRWPVVLTPLYSLARKLPWTRDGARRLGLVTQSQMIGALVEAIEHPPDDVTGPRVWEVPRIAQGRAP